MHVFHLNALWQDYRGCSSLGFSCQNHYTEGRYIHEFPKLPNFTVERNLMTFATSRTGKGATQIIPFLLQSNDRNCLVIDPKGEALETTYQHRRALGHNVAALDPFKTARIADQDRAKMNFLDGIDPENPNAFRQIKALCDGLVMRHDPRGGHWDDGALEVLAGFVAHVLSAPEYEGRRSLITVRKLLTAHGDLYIEIVEAMAENHAIGGMPATAASRLMQSGTEADHFISGARGNTDWLDDPHMQECLSESTFRMADLKTHKLDIFLVLPMDTLGDYGRFLCLFTRMALYQMQHADTANLVSRGAGLVAEHELKVKPPAKPTVDTRNGGFFDTLLGRRTYEQNLYHEAHKAPPSRDQFLGDWEADKHARTVGQWQALQQNKEAEFQDAMNTYGHARACVGYPRVPPEQVAQITKRNERRKIADNALVLREGMCYLHPLTAYFERQAQRPALAPPVAQLPDFLRGRKEEARADRKRQREQNDKENAILYPVEADEAWAKFVQDHIDTRMRLAAVKAPVSPTKKRKVNFQKAKPLPVEKAASDAALA